MKYKLTKADLIRTLMMEMSDQQWKTISLLIGRRIADYSPAEKVSFLKKLFTKTRSHAGAKGIARGLQQWTAKKISEVTNIPCGKDEEIQSREMGQSGPDVRMSVRAYMAFGFTPECKSGKTWSLPSAIKQAQVNCYPFTQWMVVLDRPHIHQEERIPPVVVLDGEVFFDIWGKSHAMDNVPVTISIPEKKKK
jgi:hypothetical protein